MDLAKNLRDVALELRKVAALLPVQKSAAERMELDPEKVRDFLIFFGGSHA